MSTKSSFALRGRNPDVLTCIANLSNDEVFTPPDFANRMLDTLTDAWAEANDGQFVWSNPDVTFLDPFTKSGVFLREITARLTKGLEDAIPDLEQRVEHILSKQVFGIGITDLTAKLARRSLYCSKLADGPHSIAKSFDTEAGNVWFERTEHTWVGGTEWVYNADETGNQIKKFTNGKCKYCGASQKLLDRGNDLETHAYAFIHTDNIEALISELFGDDMQFDVIVGNPPYQLSDGGSGASAAPIYQKFVEQAKKLEPRFLSMVIPSRWFSGGKGLDEFRESMLSDRRVRSIDDYLNSSDAFPGVELQGGICYFLWDRENAGDCRVTTYYNGAVMSVAERPLLCPGSDTFVRHNDAIPIVQKVMDVESGCAGAPLNLPDARRFANLVSPRKPFGLPTNMRGKPAPFPNSLLVYQFGGSGYVPRDSITTGKDLIGKWKLFIGRAHGGQGHGRDVFPTVVIGKPFIGEPNSACTETYMYIGPFESENEAVNAMSYVGTRLFRFLVLMRKPSQDATRRVYGFVPLQDFSEPWSDEK